MTKVLLGIAFITLMTGGVWSDVQPIIPANQGPGWLLIVASGIVLLTCIMQRGQNIRALDSDWKQVNVHRP